MSILLTNARLIDPAKRTDQLGSVLIKKSKIRDVIYGELPELPDDVKVIDCGGKCLAPGIIDIGVKVGEPGERHMESFASAGRAAAAGGVTTMVLRPDTNPAVDSPETLQFIHRRAIDDAGAVSYTHLTLPTICSV